MPKKVLQDMVKTKRVNTPIASIKKDSITRPSSSPQSSLQNSKNNLDDGNEIKMKVVMNKQELEQELFNRPRPRVSLSDEIGNNKERSNQAMWFIAIICVFVLLFSVSLLFVEAKVTINPHVEDLNLNENLSAVRDQKTDGLSFDLVVLSGNSDTTLTATEQSEVEMSAKGTAIIYNNFSGATQALDINTRLEGSNGKMYKTEKKVVVPGKKSDGTPGSVEVGIYGFEPGAEYNSGPLDFKIFGFKGSPKYTKFYARSKGDITGGKKGLSPAISDETKNTAISGLEDSLKAKLIQKVESQIPEGFILFKDATFMQIDNKNEKVDLEKNTITLDIRATLYGILLKESELTALVAKNKVKDYSGEESYIKDLSTLTFDLSTSPETLKDAKIISFNLSGITDLVFKVDEDKIASDLLGKRKKDFNSLMTSYKNIDSANLVLKPFWKKTIPDKLKDIKVLVNYGE